MSDTTQPKPQADTTLAALAVLERFHAGDYGTVDVLLDSTDQRELVIGLLDVSRYFADMLSKASDAPVDRVISHVRETVIGLVRDGRLGAGPINLPATAEK